MSATVRQIRHLRLVAGSETAARAAVTRLEDALRCASLPDTGARLLLVRRLALGDLGRHASSQTIARVIEARFADRAVRWTRGESITGGDDLARAEQVVFLSAWHAKVALTHRLLRGASCTGWYWPLAVPEFRVDLAAGDNIRSIMQAIAQSGEAAVALPAWAVQVVLQAGGPALAAMVPARLGEQLLRAAGLAVPPLADPAAHSSADRTEPLPVPHWLRQLLQIGGQPLPTTAGATNQPAFDWAGRYRSERQGHGDASDTTATTRDTDADADSGAGPPARPPQEKSVAASGRPALPQSVTRWVEVDPQTSRTGLPVSALQPFKRSPTGPVITALPPATSAVVHPSAPLFDTMPTACAGLLFLLPVMARLGLPAWAEGTALDARRSTRGVLAAVLERLRVPRDDAVWAVVVDTDGTVPSNDAVRTTRWIAALRRWLHQNAQLDLATLVQRGGWIALTPLHIDVFFRLADADLRVRRLGLDVDPGWLPWLGRVVTYHYGEAPQPP